MKIAKELFKALDLIDNYLPRSIKRDSLLIIPGNKEIDLLRVGFNSFHIIDKELKRNYSNRKSKLTNCLVEEKDFMLFIMRLAEESKIFSLNHIGFCYQVESRTEERKRLSKLAREHNHQLYEIVSDESALWLFMAKYSPDNEPILEFLPVESSNGFYDDYWLPHIHIDLDTMILKEKLKYLIHGSFKGKRSANISVADNERVYQIRLWLGVIDGINLCLDMTTDEFGTAKERRKYQTQNEV